ncbi:hypothetical protein [Bosea sp. R86505]|uniref:hypothetical protein n=1 Tax=Bosea sp. R86505 TaxID=3101710 RepID=UPI003672A087
MTKFWKRHPYLAPKEIRSRAPAGDFIKVQINPSDPGPTNPFKGGVAGAPHHTDLENELRAVQAIQIADLDVLAQARADAIAVRNEIKKNRPEASPSTVELLKGIYVGPANEDTLLPDGRSLSKKREAKVPPTHQGYLLTNQARCLASNNDIEGLDRLIQRQKANIALVGRARVAAAAGPSGLRAIMKQVNNGSRPSDENMSKRIIDSPPVMRITEMAKLSRITGIVASRIWVQYHGEPGKIDYYRLFELAVFAGQLERGEPAHLRWEVARYLLQELYSPSAGNILKVICFPNVRKVKFALRSIYDSIDASYGLAGLTGELILCHQQGQSKTFQAP